MQPNIKTKQMKIIPAETSKNIVPSNTTSDILFIK